MKRKGSTTMSIEDSLMLSYLQFAVVRLLCQHGQMSGRRLRIELEQLGIQQSRPSFYELMRSCTTACLVEGRLNETMIRDVGVKGTLYRVTSRGKKALLYQQFLLAGKR